MSERVHQLVESAKVAIANQEWRRARLFLEELTHLLPQHPVMAYNRGLVYWKLGELDNAERWLTQAVQLDGNYQEAAAALKYIRDQRTPAPRETAPAAATAAAPPPQTPAATATTTAVAAPTRPDTLDDELTRYYFGVGLWPRDSEAA